VFVEFGGLSHGVLLWRSMTQWFGGMGIIVLALVILPALGVGRMQLYKREVPGPTSEKLTPRLRDTARATPLRWRGVLAAPRRRASMADAAAAGRSGPAAISTERRVWRTR
jgi:hypothetical protein